MFQTAKFRRHAAVPKPRARTKFVPSLPHDDLAFILGNLAPEERKALTMIVETADLAEVDGRRFLVVPVDDDTLDTLAAFGSEQEDREFDLEDDVETDNDEANDAPADMFDEREPQEGVAPAGATKSYEAHRQRKRDEKTITHVHRWANGQGQTTFHDFAGSHDHEELRKVQYWARQNGRARP